MSPRRLLVTYAMLLLAACASSPELTREQGTGATDPRILAAEKDLSRVEAELQRQRAAAAVDCPRACELTATICKLAERICILAKQNAAETLAPRCRDARQRCQRARQDTAISCSCEETP
jgi:hypothetical protein